MSRRQERWGAVSRAVLVCSLSLVCADARAGDWPFYRHDLAGTSNAGEALSVQQAQGFHQQWVFPAPIIGNPIVANGMVFVTGAFGSFYALDEASGTLLWSHAAKAHGPFHCFPLSTTADTKGPVGAPAAVGTSVFAPGGDGVVYAHDTKTGAILWQTQIADVTNKGEFLWSSAFPLGSRVYFGVASLHDCLLVPGRVVALDQTTGSVLGTWWADPNHGPGGGVWTQPAYDSRTNRMFLTTGTIAPNLTPAQEPAADAFVAIDPITMQTLDSFTPFDATSGSFYQDVDFGASPTIFDTASGAHLIAATNKNGFVYALDRDHLAAGIVWSYQVSGDFGDPDVGLSNIVSPAFANNTLFVGGTKTVDGFSGLVAALDPATGAPRWLFHPPNGGFVLAALATAGNLLLVSATQKIGLPGTLYVLDQSTGLVVFSMPATNALFSEPTYSNGTLYFGDLGGHLWALSPGPAGAGGGGGGAFSDLFNRTTGLGAAWTVPHGVFVTNGSAALGTAAQSYAFWTGTPDPDATVSITVTSPFRSTYSGVVARANAATPDAAHYAAFLAPDGSVGLARRTNYTYAQLASAPKLSAGTHLLSLSVTGSNPALLTVSVDGAAVIHATDGSSTALSAGLAGVFDYNGASQPLAAFAVTSPGGTTATDGGTPGTDAGVPDAGVPDAGVPDAGVPDAGVPDAGVPDAGVPDAGVPDAGMNGPPPAFLDDFQRTSGLGSAWTVAHGAFTTNGTGAIGTAPLSYAFWSGAPNPDATVSFAVTAPIKATYVGVIARATLSFPDGNHYAGFIEPDGTLGIARRINSSYTYLAFGPKLGPGSHVIGLTAAGFNPVKLSVSVDGTVVLTAQDSGSAALSSGLAGLFDYKGASQPLEAFTVSQ